MSIRGKYTGKKTPAETILKINLEAAHEVARQLSLRNLSGIIIVDFIDMESKEDQETLMRTLGEELSRDPVKTILVDMTRLGWWRSPAKNLIPRWQNNSRDNKIKQKRYQTFFLIPLTVNELNRELAIEVLHAAGAVVEAFPTEARRCIPLKSMVPHHEKLFIDSVIHQSTVLLAGFLLYFTIFGTLFGKNVS
mgnify:CR=1 FL=1